MNLKNLALFFAFVTLVGVALRCSREMDDSGLREVKKDTETPTMLTDDPVPTPIIEPITRLGLYQDDLYAFDAPDSPVTFNAGLDGFTALSVINVKNRNNPEVKSSVPLVTPQKFFIIKNSLSYLIGTSKHLSILVGGRSDSLASYPDVASINSCLPPLAKDDYLFIVGTIAGTNNKMGCSEALNPNQNLFVIKVATNPDGTLKSLTLVSTFKLNMPRAIDIDGDVFFVCDRDAKVLYIDVSDPTKPMIKATIDNIQCRGLSGVLS